MVLQQSAPSGTTASADITPAELRLATRNHGMPLEVLRQDVTPIGLHYLLIHYDIPFVDDTTWRLGITGNVSTQVELSLEQLRQRPSVTQRVTLECAGNGRSLQSPRTISQPWLHEAIGTAEWTGTPLAGLLEDAGIGDGTVEILFTGMDRGVEGGHAQYYERSLTLDHALRDEVLVAWEINGHPLPPQHGFPARLVVPGWYGMASVKWLQRITAVTEPFQGHQMMRSYRLRQTAEETGEAVGQIAVRSLIAPPGIPDFASRDRHVPQSGCEVLGRAWSGAGPIQRVEVSDDLGRTWQDAVVDPPVAPFAWQSWRLQWLPTTSGRTELWSRATDAAGATQPVDPAWNLGGYMTNPVHRVPVIVGDD
jgi:DMSO/TMAO reductase YedYZ molybdopterin-dependent catalytic subunit